MNDRAIHTIDCDVRPRFTAAYLRVDGAECAFVETHTSHALPRLLGALAGAHRKPEDVRWVVVTHAHLDHAGGASAALLACPNATLLAHPRAAKHLIDPAKLVASATAVYGAERFASLYGVIEPIDAARVQTLDDGATFDLGASTLRVLHTAGHANHHFAVHDPALDTVFTGDTFGLVYPDLQRGGLFAVPSTSPTNFDAPEARKSLDRVLALGTRSAYPTHFGEVRALADIAAQVRAWIDRAEAWLDDAVSGEESAAAITERLAGAWRRAIERDAEARGLEFDASSYDLLKLDIELNAQGIAAVTEARRKRASK